MKTDEIRDLADGTVCSAMLDVDRELMLRQGFEEALESHNAALDLPVLESRIAKLEAELEELQGECRRLSAEKLRLETDGKARQHTINQIRELVGR